MGGSCTDVAINACLDLLDCCRAILVNPVFFQSCNSVVLQCDEQRCRELLCQLDRDHCGDHDAQREKDRARPARGPAEAD